jgi:polyphenol oxidase
VSDVEVIRARGLGDVPHGFLGRRGGVSQGLVAGLNVGLGSQDDPACPVRRSHRCIRSIRRTWCV